jgi:3-oxoacyl-[acyl-carrier protein] reductase
MADMQGQVALVTGGGRGIGRAICERLLGRGMRIAAGYSRNSAAAEELQQKFPEAEISIHQGNIGEAQDCERVVGEVMDKYGQLDVLVNNAGTASWRDLDDVPDEDWYAAWELNVMAPMRLMRAAAPGMRERGWGRVVNVSSTAGKRPSAAMAEYSVAKAAELSLSRLYADRYAPHGVLINAICPGPVKSELWMEEGGLLDQSKEVGGHADREEALDVAGGKRPIGRLAEVEEVAAAIVFLCSERASYVSGAAWSVDGGTVQVII